MAGTGSFGTTYEGVDVVFVQGDITDSDTEAIVNAANNHLWMGAGVAGAIKRKGGKVIEDEAVSKGPIEIGGAVVTSAGRLRARYVIHAAVMGQDLRTDHDKIYRATVSSLERALELGVRSIALPALGTGVGGVPYDEAARAMLAAVKHRLSKGNGGLERVVFVLYGRGAYEAFVSQAKVALYGGTHI